jgi:hypothetical protein
VSLGIVLATSLRPVAQRMSPDLGGLGEGRLVDTGGETVKLRLPCGVAVEGEAIELDDRPPSRLAAPDARAPSDGAPGCSMLVHAAVASCWVVGSSTIAVKPPSLSARRDSDRASHSSAVTAVAEGGSGRSTSSSVMPSIVLCRSQAAHDEPSSGNS